MNNIVTSLSAIDYVAILPEIFLLSMLVLILLLECVAKNLEIKVVYLLSLVTLVGAAVMAFVTESILPTGDGGASTYYWLGEIAHSSTTTILKVSMLGVVFIGLVYGYPKLAQDSLNRTEYFLLILLGTLGMLVLVSSYSLLMVYLGLELMSLPMYALVAFNRQSNKGTEAAMKYFVMGAMASGILLYGMALLYGATGSLNLGAIQTFVAQIAENDLANNKLLVFAIVFIVVGIAFKLGAAPFHSWVPDVYEGAPISVALYVAAAPKIAAVAMAFLLLGVAGFNITENWQMMLGIVAVLSFILGNLIALKQLNIRRMLGYSAVSHAGFMLLGVFAGDNGDVASSAYFYAITYALTTTAAFGFILALNNNGAAVEKINDLKGFARDYPWYGLLMSIIMLSMAGIPPFVGFYAKFFVLKNAYVAGYWPVVVIGLVTSVIGLFYYLRVIKVMFFDEKESYNNVVVDACGCSKALLTINVLVIVLLGLVPTLLANYV